MIRSKPVGFFFIRTFIILIAISGILFSCSTETPKETYLEAQAFSLNKNGTIQEIIAVDSSLYAHVPNWDTSAVLKLNFDGKVTDSYTLPFQGKLLFLENGGWILYTDLYSSVPVLEIYNKDGVKLKTIHALGTSGNLNTRGTKVLLLDDGFLNFIHYHNYMDAKEYIFLGKYDLTGNLVHSRIQQNNFTYFMAFADIVTNGTEAALIGSGWSNGPWGGSSFYSIISFDEQLNTEYQKTMLNEDYSEYKGAHLFDNGELLLSTWGYGYYDNGGRMVHKFDENGNLYSSQQVGLQLGLTFSRYYPSTRGLYCIMDFEYSGYPPLLNEYNKNGEYLQTISDDLKLTYVRCMVETEDYYFVGGDVVNYFNYEYKATLARIKKP